VEIAGVREEHATALEALAAEHTAQAETRQAAHAAALEALTTKHDAAFEELISKRRSQLVSAQAVAAKLELRCSKTTENLKSKTKECEDLNLQLKESQSQLSTSKTSMVELQEGYDSVFAEKALVETEHTALQGEFETRLISAVKQKDVECIKDIAEAVKESVAEKDKYMRYYTKENKLRKVIHNKILELCGNIRVLCRVRPVLDVERKQGSGQDVDVTDVTSDQDIIITRDGGNQRTKFEYDAVFNSTSVQKDVFEAVKPLCRSVLDGFNICIFAYGQTGSGKTYTMEGEGIGVDAGITPRAISSLFASSSNNGKSDDNNNEDDDAGGFGTWTYRFELQILEIYNENILDLLPAVTTPTSGKDKDNKNLNIKPKTKAESGLDLRQTKTGMTVVDLTSRTVSTPEEVYTLLQRAKKNRAVGSHDLNEHSSRSHAIVILHTYGTDSVNQSQSYGKMHLIDLAGSERQSKTDATGDRLNEANHINKSLSALGDVIGALGSSNKAHIPYRNSKLTHLLQDSLGGNSKVLMVVNISPAIFSEGETVCSLNFASRCRNVELGKARRNVTSSAKVEA